MAIAPYRVRDNLPLALTSFVGRGAELDTVRRLVSESRLVTLTGAGGIGKTRLALEFARQTVDIYRDGAWIVELAPIINPDLVPDAVLAALGLRALPDRGPAESLIAGLAGREMLFVLDNCEHLINACAQLTYALLQGCPRLSILATSREVLGVGGETTWRVPSMVTRGVSRSMTIEELERLEAVQLFVQRVSAARPDFQLTEDNAASAARICHRLDGIPLAIELAAARARALSVDTIEKRLDDRFHLLSGGSRVSLPRQQTLQAALDWSHDLLDSEQQRLLRRLSVFSGACTLEAVEIICMDGEATPATASAFDLLSDLVDKSLVNFEESADQATRYRLLETIREYGAVRLFDSEEGDAIRGRHAEYYFEAGKRMSDGLRGAQQGAWFARVEEELDNIRACLEWALNRDPRHALQLILDLERYWKSIGRAEGRAWLTRALNAFPDRDERLADGLCNASLWASFQGHTDEARRLGQECLSVATEIGSGLYVGQALGALAMMETIEGGDDWARVSNELFEQAETYLRAANDPEALRRLLNNHGYTLYEAGDAAAGRPKVEEALAIARAMQDDWQVQITLESLASIEYQMGETDAAVAHWKEVLALAGQLRSLLTASSCLIGLAEVALTEAQPARCLRLLAAATEFQARTGAAVADASPAEARILTASRDVAREQIGPDAADSAWKEGARMSLDDAVRYGLGDPKGVETHLPPRATEAQMVPTGDNRFLREGDFWTVSFARRVVRLRDSKGLQDIARLLGAPGKGVAAVDLAAVVMPAIAGSRARVAELGLGIEAGVGAMLDPQARRQYRERIFELEDETSEAEANNDPERAGRAREERAVLLAELKAALGLGGKDRQALDPAERARKAVTWRIRQAISRIEATHPELGRHLRRSVRTGTFCVYDPPEPIHWDG